MAVIPGSRTDRAYRVAVNSEPDVWQNRLNTLYAPISVVPFSQHVWPIPRNSRNAGYRVAIDSVVWQDSAGTLGVKPDLQTEWPNPLNSRDARYRAAISSQAAVAQNFTNLTADIKPFVQNEWPNPLHRLVVRYHAAIQSESGVWQNPHTTLFYPIFADPFRQNDWTNPLNQLSRARQVARDAHAGVWQNRLLGLFPPNTPPFRQTEWPNPGKHLIVSRQVAVNSESMVWQNYLDTLYIALADPPFHQTEWPVPGNRLSAARLAALLSVPGAWSNPILGPIFPTLLDEEDSRRIFDIHEPHTLLVDCSKGTFLAHTVTLPSIQVMGVRRYFIKRVDNTPTRSLTVRVYNGDTIEGATSVSLPNQYDWVELLSDNVHTWFICSTG